MLYIPPHSTKVTKAKLAFKKAMIDLIDARMYNLVDDYDIDTIKTFEYIIKGNIEDILIGDPFKLVHISSLVNQVIDYDPKFKSAVNYVLNYDWFITKKTTMYCAYDLANDLDINTCTYCNRNYTVTVIKKDGKKITRPQFDHFFNKADNPVLALSFYNLVPSCSICNSGIKGSDPVNLNDHLHPYIDDSIHDIVFSYKYSNAEHSGLRILVKTPIPSKVYNTTQLFAVEEVYNAHAGELKDLLRVKRFFSDRYLDILKKSLLNDVIISKSELYRVLFGTEYEARDFVKRPFSKFKSDILKELGVI